METDFIFHHGVDLPDFAASPVLDTLVGRELLTRCFDDYAAIARRVGAGLLSETPTWRASPDWGARLGYTVADLTRAVPIPSRYSTGCAGATAPTSTPS